MAAIIRSFPCVLQNSSKSWLILTENPLAAVSVLAIRFYRGSNRDTKRRDRNERARQRKREGLKEKVFDKREFIKINYQTELFAFKNRLSLANMDDKTLSTALTHESDTDCDGDNNSILTLIGYNLVTHYTTEYLCFKYPALPSEGIRCLLEHLTSREAIVKVAESIALHELIKSELDLETLNQEKHLDYTREDVISDTFYALIGAIYKDQGSREANMFIRDFLLTQLHGKDLHTLLNFKDSSNLLNTLVLSEGRPKAEARIIRESGKRTHLPVFVVGIFSGDNLLGEAASYNITKAKHEATLASLMKLFQRDMKQQPSLPADKEDFKLHSHS